MRRAVAAVLGVATVSWWHRAYGVLAAAPAALPKTHECDKVKVCVHIPGPWVVVPATGERRGCSSARSVQAR